MTNLSLVSHIDHLTPKKPTRGETLKSRTYAFVVDLYSIVFLNKMIAFTWVSFVNKFISNIALVDKTKSSLLFNGVSNFSLPIIFISYFFFFYYLNSGKTIGKMLFKLKVCAKNDRSRELTFVEAFSRAAGYLFCNYLFFIPFALVYLRKDTKGIHDYISSTYVLREDEIALLESLEENPSDSQISLFPEDPVANRISKVI